MIVASYQTQELIKYCWFHHTRTETGMGQKEKHKRDEISRNISNSQEVNCATHCQNIK